MADTRQGAKERPVPDYFRSEAVRHLTTPSTTCWVEVDLSDPHRKLGRGFRQVAQAALKLRANSESVLEKGSWHPGRHHVQV